ncbi:hypothetical protein DF047_13475 [Burkholderia cenocepacia]|nr:hypothetical protein DF047_13475 [Burkholderia cenocepacia]
MFRVELRLTKLGVTLGRGGHALLFERLAVSWCPACLRPDDPVVIIARVLSGRADGTARTSIDDFRLIISENELYGRRVFMIRDAYY